MTATTSLAPPLTTRRQPAPFLVLLVASFGAFLAFLDSTIVNVAFPDIAASFPGTSIGALSWVLTAYNIVFAAFLVVAGGWPTCSAGGETFLVGVAVFTVASGLCAAATSVETWSRTACCRASGRRSWCPRRWRWSSRATPGPARARRRAVGRGRGDRVRSRAADRGRAGRGGGLAPRVPGQRPAGAGRPWSWPAAAWSRAGPPGRRRTPDLRGALLLAATLGLLTLGLVQGPEWGWDDPSCSARSRAAVAAGVGFVLSSRAHPTPCWTPRCVRIPSFAIGIALTVVAGAGFYAYLLTHILFLNTVWGYTLLEAGLAVAPAALVATVVAAVLGRVADARGHRLIIVPGALVWAAGLIWYSPAGRDHPRLPRRLAARPAAAGGRRRRDAAGAGQRGAGPASRKAGRTRRRRPWSAARGSSARCWACPGW